METTGEAGRIHISDATATLLQQGGRGHWLEKREASIVAKGKGKLQVCLLPPTRKHIDVNNWSLT
jgi:hypothetical protein